MPMTSAPCSAVALEQPQAQYWDSLWVDARARSSAALLVAPRAQRSAPRGGDTAVQSSVRPWVALRVQPSASQRAGAMAPCWVRAQGVLQAQPSAGASASHSSTGNRFTRPQAPWFTITRSHTDRSTSRCTSGRCAVMALDGTTATGVAIIGNTSVTTAMDADMAGATTGTATEIE